jgi:hypothetical protein
MDSTAPTSSTVVDAPAPFAVVRFQSVVSLTLLLLLSVLFLTVDLLARSQSVARWFNQRNLASAQKDHRVYVRYDQFMDNIDYLWLERLEKANYSHGGVYLFGSSIAICSLQDWALAPNLAAVIHNYGYSGANMADTAQFIRFLINYKGLLTAGPDKSLIILGLTYGDIGNSLDARNYFKQSLLRSGLYDYDSAVGITPIPFNPVQRFLKFEEMRCCSFLLAVNGLGKSPSPRMDQKKFRAINVIRMGNNWPLLLTAQMHAETDLLDDLKKSRVHVVGVLLPEGSWNAGIPAHDQFMPQIRKLFADRSLPLIDCTRLVPDSGFADSLHYDVDNEPIIHQAMMTTALAFLRHSGALGPEAATSR